MMTPAETVAWMIVPVAAWVATIITGFVVELSMTAPHGREE
jgi:hypothetical protein